jgi:hypothetical protein
VEEQEMMMFAFFPLFAVFFLLFISDSLERTILRRARNRRNSYSDTEDIPVDLKDRTSSTGGDPAQIYQQLQVTVFRLAARNKGRLTLSDVIVETGLDLNKAEKLMDRMIDGAHVQIDVNDKGMILYVFPEMISKAEHEEA